MTVEQEVKLCKLYMRPVVMCTVH